MERRLLTLRVGRGKEENTTETTFVVDEIAFMTRQWEGFWPENWQTRVLKAGLWALGIAALVFVLGAVFDDTRTDDPPYSVPELMERGALALGILGGALLASLSLNRGHYQIATTGGSVYDVAHRNLDPLHEFRKSADTVLFENRSARVQYFHAINLDRVAAVSEREISHEWIARVSVLASLAAILLPIAKVVGLDGLPDWPDAWKLSGGLLLVGLIASWIYLRTLRTAVEVEAVGGAKSGLVLVPADAKRLRTALAETRRGNAPVSSPIAAGPR